MKYILLSILIMITFFVAKAQKYIPLVKNGAVWKQYYKQFWDQPEYHGSSITRQYKIERDTILNGREYHLLSFAEMINGYDKNGQVNFSDFKKKKIGALREDSSKHVYFYNFSNLQDTLLYDFNLEQYEYLPQTYLYKGGYSQGLICCIDSVYLGGQYHKRYGIASYGSLEDPYTYLIEGIGNTAGLFTVFEPQPQEETRLICFSVNGENIYRSNENVDCSIVTSIIDDKKLNPVFNIYPNPTTGQFTIQTQSIFADSYICVRDILGRIVLQEKLQSPNQIINIADQSKGLYFMELRSGNKKSVQKLILE